MPEPRAIPGVPCPRCGRPGLVALVGKDGVAKVRCGARWRMVRPGQGEAPLGSSDLPRLAEAAKRSEAREPSELEQEQLDEKCPWEALLSEVLL